MGSTVGLPTRTGSAIALGLAGGAVALVANDQTQTLPLAVEVVGALVLLVGATVRRRGRPLVGWAVALFGVATVAWGFRLGIALPDALETSAELLAGMAGVALLALGLLPVRARWSRQVVTIGAVVVAGVALTSGALDEASTTSALVAVAATAVAWDAAEQAIGLGEQVGADANTLGVELVHSSATAVVAAVAVAVAVAVGSLDGDAVPLAGLVLLLGAAIALTMALYD